MRLFPRKRPVFDDFKGAQGVPDDKQGVQDNPVAAAVSAVSAAKPPAPSQRGKGKAAVGPPPLVRRMTAATGGEDRRATASGPQIFCVLMDNSISMEEGAKAVEATRVLREFMAYASQQNGRGDSTGNKTYFLTQVVMFAEKLDDVMGGIVRPPAVLAPMERWQVRHPACAARIGNTTDFQKPLEHVYATLTGSQGLTTERLEAAMPAPVVLLITDGKPTRPLPESQARDAARSAARRIRELVLPEATRRHPTREEERYAATAVKLIAIGLGSGDELDQEFLKEIASAGRHDGDEFPLYLHCPDVSQLRMLGSQIVGTLTRADQSATRRIEDVIWELNARK